MHEQVVIRVVEASDVEARIEVIHTGAKLPDGVLGGTINGPRREGSRTLPATVNLQTVHGRDVPTAEAVLPDPCFWSPDMPFLYDVSLEVRRGDEVVDSGNFSIALHPKRVVKQ